MVIRNKMVAARQQGTILGFVLLAIIHAASGFAPLQRQRPLAKHRRPITAKKNSQATSARSASSQPTFKRRSLVEFIPSGSLTPTLGALFEPRKNSWLVTTADGSTLEVPLEAITYVDSSAPGWLPLDANGPNLARTLAACTAAATSAVADTSRVVNTWQAIREAEASVGLPQKSFVSLAGIFHAGSGTTGPEKSAEKAEGAKPSTAERYATHALLQSPSGKVHFAPCTSSVKQPSKQLWVNARSPEEVATALAALDSAKAARKQWEGVANTLAERVQTRRKRQQEIYASNTALAERKDSSENSTLIDSELIQFAVQDLEALAIEFDPSGNAMPKPLRALSSSTPSSPVATSDTGNSEDLVDGEEPKSTNALPGGFAACFLGLGPLSAWSRDARGAFGLLVALGHWSTHHDLSLSRSTLPHARPWRPETLKAQAELMLHPPLDPFAASPLPREVNGQSVVGNRKDLTHMTCYAIDSEDTYEVDDAVSAEHLDEHGQPLPNGEGGAARNHCGKVGRVRYWVHAVDVSRWLPNPHCELAQETRRRQTSLYLPYGKQPMLPAALVARDMALAPPHANHPPPYEGTSEYTSSLSLGGGGVGPSPEDAMKGLAATCATVSTTTTSKTTRPTLSVGFELDPDTGALVADSVVLCAATIRVAMRLSYEECDDMLHLGLGGLYEPDWALGCLEQAAIARQAWRKSQCPAFFQQLPFMDVKAWPEHKTTAPIDSKLPGDSTWCASAQPAGASQCRSSLLVSELMVASGEAVGMLGRKHRIVLPYRSQVAANRGSGPPSQSEVEEEVAELDAVSDGDWRCRSYRLRKYMGKGSTTPKPGKHYGLGLDQYVILSVSLPIC